MVVVFIFIAVFVIIAIIMVSGSSNSNNENQKREERFKNNNERAIAILREIREDREKEQQITDYLKNELLKEKEEEYEKQA
jgi:large-conductance mechanosensitive channel